MSYTPSNLLASVGLLQNTGLDLSLISGIASNYNNQSIPLAYRAALSAAGAADDAVAEANGNISTNYVSVVTDIGVTRLPGLLALTPTNYKGALGNDGLGTAALTQAQLIFPGGDISSFIQNLTRCTGMASITGELFRTAKSITQRPFIDFGSLDRYNDLGTAGLGKISKISNENLAATGEALKKIGITTPLNSSKINDNFLFSADSQFDQYVTPAVEPNAKEFVFTTDDGSTEITIQSEFIHTKDQKYLNPVSNPVTVAINILNRGLGYIGNFETQLCNSFNCNADEIVDLLTTFQNNKFAQQKVTAILITINRSADIQDLKSGLNLSDDLTITSFNDLVDFQDKVPEISAVANSAIIKEVETVLSSIPGGENIKSYADLGNLAGELEDLPSTPILDSRNVFFTVGDLNAMKNYIPLFDNDNLGPTTADMIGVVAGGAVGTSITSAATETAKSLNVSEGVNILANLNLIYTTLITANVEVDYTTTIQGYVDNIESEMDSLINSSNGYKKEIVTATKSGYINGCRLLYNQKVSLARMDIDLTQVSAGAKIPLISFGRSLGDLAKDPAIEAILTPMCSSNAYGEAIKLHIKEKQNIAIMQKFGLNPSNTLQIPKIDPDEFSF